jgi:hypothetical protein
VTADFSTGLVLSSHFQIAAEAENVMNQMYALNLNSEFNGTHMRARVSYPSGLARASDH